MSFSIYSTKKNLAEPIPYKKLQSSWKNRKAYVKQKARSLKKSLKATGGGQPDPPLNPESEKILATLDDDDVELPSNFDSESTEETQVDETQYVVQEIEVESSAW